MQKWNEWKSKIEALYMNQTELKYPNKMSDCKKSQ